MKKIFIAFSFLFFLNSFSASASSIPENIPSVPSPPLSSEKNNYIMGYCTSGCTSTLLGKFTLIYYDSFTFNTAWGDARSYIFSKPELYYYDNLSGSWVFSSSSASEQYSYDKKNGYRAIKTNDKALKKDMGDDFFLMGMGELETVVKALPMEKALTVILEVLPIVVSLIVSYLGLRKAFHWLLLQLKGC